MSELELRLREAEVVGVSFPERIIDLIVIPYERETTVRHPSAPRMVTEIISRGAFDGIERRASRVRVNRDHDVRRTVGRALSFTSQDDGLHARVRIARTELGDETLTLADDEILDASAGFGLLRDDKGRVVAGAEAWETRERVRVNKGWLGHIALTPDPAYVDARVLAVRSDDTDPGRTAHVAPNLASLELAGWAAKLDEIDRRYKLNL